MQGDYAGAESLLLSANLKKHQTARLISAAVYGQLGATEAAERERQWIVENADWMRANIHTELTKRFGNPEDRQHLAEGLAKSGLKLPATN